MTMGVNPEKTPEELAEIAYLDRLRTCEGEEMPVGLPLACIVKVVGYGMKGENAYEADRICRIELSCPDKPAGLTIRALTDEGQVFDEIVFARTLKDGGELP